MPADAVILAIGVAPETGLAKAAGLEIGETGGILVDHNYRTSDKNIYAVGDAIEVFDRMTGETFTSGSCRSGLETGAGGGGCDVWDSQ